VRSHAAITVLKPRDEVERLWRDPELRPEYIEEADASVTFKTAPGDRGTEIHVRVEQAGGKLAQALKKVTGQEPVAKVKDDLRRFKALAETGEIARSDGAPEGERAERKLKQRPAQPLDAGEREKAGI
jgi:uncharacterized membrane protein